VSSGDVRIAWATEADAAALVPLLRALHLHDVAGAAPPDDAMLAAHAARLINPATPHRLAIAWSHAGRAVGLAAAGLFVSVSDPRPDHAGQMELKELFVLADVRGQGVGEQLMAWVEVQARAAGVARIDWHVKRDNQRGIAFYERLGGRIVEDRLSMRKSLKY
jgi:GNAT superfamily N-acetyltransferase